MKKPCSRFAETKIWKEIEESCISLKHKLKLLKRLRETNKPKHYQIFMDEFLDN